MVLLEGRWNRVGSRQPEPDDPLEPRLELDDPEEPDEPDDPELLEPRMPPELLELPDEPERLFRSSSFRLSDMPLRPVLLLPVREPPWKPVSSP